MRQGFCEARSRTDGCSHAEGLPWVGCMTGAVLEKKHHLLTPQCHSTTVLLNRRESLNKMLSKTGEC